MAGMLSFGHAAMFGAGGYALALLAPQFGFVPSLLAAAVAGAVLAFLLSVFALRVSGLFFSLLTLALGAACLHPGEHEAACVHRRSRRHSRRAATGFVRRRLLQQPQLFLLPRRGVRDRGGDHGRVRASRRSAVLKAVQANDVRAEQIGYNVQRLRQCAFMISGALSPASAARCWLR